MLSFGKSLSTTLDVDQLRPLGRSTALVALRVGVGVLFRVAEWRWIVMSRSGRRLADGVAVAFADRLVAIDRPALANGLGRLHFRTSWYVGAFERALPAHDAGQPV